MQSNKPQIKLMIIGEPQSGKTTLASHLVYKSGSIDPKIIERLHEDINGPDGESLKFSRIFNKFNSEREQDMNLNQSFDKFQTEKYEFSIIKASSHPDFITTVISGVSLADALILVVTPRMGDYETGIQNTFSLRGPIPLAFTLGIKNLIVCINNMDNKMINYSQQYFEEYKLETSNYLKKVGYNPSTVSFIPISSWTGENISDKSPNLSWFEGLTLLESLNKITPPKEPIDKPFRLSIEDIYKIKEMGAVYSGKIEAGIIRPDMSICITPSNVITNIKEIQVSGKEVQEAVAGDYVGFTVWAPVNKLIRRGAICSQTQNDPPKQVVQFRAQVIVYNFPAKIFAGYCPVIKCHNARIACKFTDIVKIDRKTGRILDESQEKSQYVQKGDCAMITMIPMKPMYVEAFEDYPSFGRFTVRDMRQTVAFGIIKSVETKPAN